MLERLHHRLVVGMGLAGVAAAWGGGVLSPVMAVVGAPALGATLLRRPARERPRVEWAFIGVALLLAARAGYIVLVHPEDRLGGMVDVLLALLVGEAWKSPGRANDIRLYVLSFALLLASTVYRPGLVFAISFVAYVVLSTVALMVGHLRRKIARYGAREVQVGRGFLLGTGGLSVITLFISVAVFLAFPRVTRSWAQGGPVFATRLAGFADEISLGDHGATLQSNPETVLRVEFPGGRPEDPAAFHWRGRSYDRFDGVHWLHSPDLPQRERGPERYRRWSGPRLRQEIYGSLLHSRVLFALHPLVDVDAHSRIRPYIDRAGDVRFFGAVAPRYAAESVAEPPALSELRDAAVRVGLRDPAPAGRYYLQLPALSPRVPALADSLTAGQATRADSARAIQDWLRGFEYTRELPATAAQTGIEYFLFQRRAGHCEYFSTAMVVLLRSVGIAARNVNGFLGGQWNEVGGHLAVTQNEAHSWVEVWHPGYGWVMYDPTPSAGPGVASADEPWFWPGRMLLDGLRHRWSKWVLDYDLANQEGLLRRAASALERDSSDSDGKPDGALAGWLLGLAVALGVAGVAWLALSARRSRPPETRLYLRLRRAYTGHGFDHIPRGAPLHFAAAVEAAGTPGAREAAAVARRYVRLRFGATAPTADQLDAMRGGLRAARRALGRR